MTYEVKGVVKDRDNGAPVANLPVVVKGMHVGLMPILLLHPMPEFVPLKEIRTDAEGKFSCVVPIYAAYRFSAGEMSHTKWGDRIIDRDRIKTEGGALVLVGPPINFGKLE